MPPAPWLSSCVATCSFSRGPEDPSQVFVLAEQTQHALNHGCSVCSPTCFPFSPRTLGASHSRHWPAPPIAELRLEGKACTQAQMGLSVTHPGGLHVHLLPARAPPVGADAETLPAQGDVVGCLPASLLPCSRAWPAEGAKETGFRGEGIPRLHPSPTPLQCALALLCQPRPPLPVSPSPCPHLDVDLPVSGPQYGCCYPCPLSISCLVGLRVSSLGGGVSFPFVGSVAHASRPDT